LNVGDKPDGRSSARISVSLGGLLFPTASVPTTTSIHHPLEIARDTFPSGETLMKALALVVAVTVALVASGCVSNQQPIGDAKVGSGTVPKTHLIMARLD
jgi:hypothetical protein